MRKVLSCVSSPRHSLECCCLFVQIGVAISNLTKVKEGAKSKKGKIGVLQDKSVPFGHPAKQFFTLFFHNINAFLQKEKNNNIPRGSWIRHCHQLKEIFFFFETKRR